jgi:hydrogenase-1 operon protein HyaF
MSGLSGIGVRVEAAAGNAHAVLREVAALLARLIETGEGGAIDLHGLPLGPADFDLLRETLGQGEASATIEAGGPSTLVETACAGVWWVTHRNDEGQVVAEHLEVARVPEILSSQAEDMRAGLARLRAQIEAPRAAHEH